MIEQKIAPRGRGRPSKLDASTSAQIAALLIRGETITETARATGVSRRALTGWLASALSRDPRDAQAVRMLQMIVRGQRAALQLGQRPIRQEVQPLDDFLAELARDVARPLDELLD